jgi:hypothetical protein
MRIKRFRSGGVEFRELDSLSDASDAEMNVRERALDLRLKGAWGTALLIALIVLMGINERLFYDYLRANHWHVDGSTINVWLGASVVQLVTLAGVVVRYLFHPKDKRGINDTQSL